MTDQPKTNSGKAVVALAEAIREDLDAIATKVQQAAEATRELAEETDGVPGMMGLCRGLASQLEAAVQAYRDRTAEQVASVTKGPRESVEKIETNVNPEHAARVRGDKRAG